MREKLKSIIFTLTIAYMIIISMCVISTSLNQVKTIEYSQIEDYEKRLNNVKEEIKNLEEDSCIKSIKSLIEFSEKTYYKDKVKIKDLYNEYNSDDSWFNRNGKTLTECNLDNDERREIVPLIFAAGIQHDELIQKYAYDYEIKILDTTRESVEPAMQDAEYNIRKNLEIEVIQKFIEVYNEK